MLIDTMNILLRILVISNMLTDQTMMIVGNTSDKLVHTLSVSAGEWTENNHHLCYYQQPSISGYCYYQARTSTNTQSWFPSALHQILQSISTWCSKYGWECADSFGKFCKESQLHSLYSDKDMHCCYYKMIAYIQIRLSNQQQSYAIEK